jgi:uncharacterized glyoxalase superfamily protein PhnB
MSVEPVLNGVHFVVGNMESTLQFYRDLGISIPVESVWSTATGAHHVDVKERGGADLGFDSAALAEAYNDGWKGSGLAGRTLLGFAVSTREDVDQTYRELVDAGNRGLQEPYDAFWGARYAIVEDPDGRHVGLMSPSDPERRTSGPSL